MNKKIDSEMLRCPCMETDSLGSDISLINDEIASLIGLLLSSDYNIPKNILDDIQKCQAYHMKMLSAVSSNDIIQSEDLDWIIEKYIKIRSECKPLKGYIYPNGHKASALMHVIRSRTRSLIRVIYLMEKTENRKIDNLIEFTNMLSNYYFYIAVKINEINNVENDVYMTFTDLKKDRK